MAEKITGKSVETVNRATEVRLMAERQMGAFLKEMPKAIGGQPFQSTGSRAAPVETQPATLAEIGITKKQSSRAQQLAAPADVRCAKVAKSENLTLLPFAGPADVR